MQTTSATPEGADVTTMFWCPLCQRYCTVGDPLSHYSAHHPEAFDIVLEAVLAGASR